MEFLGFTYAELALGGSLVAAVIGLAYSLVDVIVKSKRDGEAKWQPLPHAIGFAIVWPALLCLFPFFIFDNLVARAARAERAWAVRLVDAPWYQHAGRVVLSFGFGIMGCYVLGFFFL